MKITAQELFEKLTNQDNLIGEKGEISFTLKDLTVQIKTKDTIGNLIQEWLKSWLELNNIEFGLRPNSQDFPDFLLDTDNPQEELLEIKSFDYERGANFDVANFLGYRRSIIEHPYRLDSNYLIIGYKMNNGLIEIADIWLKKVWEITGPSADWPLKCQVKQGDLVNIRPIKWYNNKNTKFKPFVSVIEFLAAFQENQYKYGKTRFEKETAIFMDKLKENYFTTTGKVLE